MRAAPPSTRRHPGRPSRPYGHVLVRVAWACLVPAGVGPVAAQAMYRCGSTYSQTPCATDAAPARLPSGAAPDAAPGLSGLAVCVDEARRRHAGPEPETARIEPLGARTSEVIQAHGQPMAAVRYGLTIDAKTAYGVFSGARPHTCWLSEDQRRVLRFEPATGTPPARVQ